MQNGVKFFLFAPHLQIGSCIGPRKGVSAVLCDCKLIYQNGANVSTSFVTNMEEAKIRTAPDLNKLLLSTQKANYQNRKGVKRVYDDHIITASLLSRLCKYYELSFAPESVYFVRTVDDLKKQKSSLYGGGFLISDKAAAEKAAAEKAAANYIGLSDREREIIKGLK